MKQVENINFTGTYKAGKILEKCDNSFLEQLKDYSLSYCKLSNKCVEGIIAMNELLISGVDLVALTNMIQKGRILSTVRITHTM